MPQVFVTEGRTYIITEYTVPCNGTVVAWEFCHDSSNSPSLTFYPGIWTTGTDSGSNTDYVLVRSNNVTYHPGDTQSCQFFNVTEIDQFITPAGSVVGLSSAGHSLLLRTNNNDSVTTYQFVGNLSSVNNGGDDVNYNIAIKLYLGKYT